MNLNIDIDIDIVIVASYMVFCLIIGLLKYGKIRNIRDYTLGFKSFPTSVLLATTFATTIGAWQIIGNVGKVYELGLVFIIPLFFLPVAWFISASILAPNLKMFRKHNFISLSEIMEHWYGQTGRWVTNILSITATIGITAISAVAIGYLLHYFINIPETIGMIIALAVVTTYSVFGGIISVAFTDVFQFLVFFIALPIACIIGYHNIGGIENIWSSLPDTHVQINTGNIILFISFIFYALIPSTGIPYIQRALIAKDKKQFLHTFMGVAILIIPLLIIVCLIGLMAYHNDSNIATNEVLYHFVDHYLPAGIKGLMIAGLLAVIMSSQDSFLNTTSALISHDICKQIWPFLNSKQELFIARISCVFIAIISISIMLLQKSILEILWLINNFWDPLISIPMMAGLIGVRINKKSFIILVLSSLTTVIATRFITGAFDTKSLVVGVVTSSIILYILHKKHQNKSFKSLLPKVSVPSYFEKLNKISRASNFSISSLYIIGAIVCFNFIAGLIFLDLTYLNLLNCSFVFAASLFLMLILNEFWHAYLKKYVIPIWKFTLIFSLVFIPSYIMFASHFHILWICNYILSITLFAILTNLVVGSAFTLLVTAVGYLVSTMIYPSEVLIIKEYALLSCFIGTIAIIVQIYTRNYIAKTTYKKVTDKFERIVHKKAIELQNALNVKNEFLNKLNHEIRTPLQGVIGISSGATDAWHTLSDKEKEQYMQMVAESGDRLMAYTSNIFDLAALKQHKFNLNIKSEVDLIELIKIEINKAKSFIAKQNKKLTIQLELKTPKPTILECDDARISQVVHNLLHNAVKYSNHGEIKVLINAMEQHVKISVSDQGVGIPNDEKLKIFDPFFEGKRTKTAAEGKGLGLAVVQEIISLHQGSIEVIDNTPCGAIFAFVLPYKIELAIQRVA